MLWLYLLYFYNVNLLYFLFVDFKLCRTLKTYCLDNLLYTRTATYYYGYDKQMFAIKNIKDIFKD